MSQSLIIKDGNGAIKSIQVNTGSNGFIPNHTLVSTVTASNVSIYYPYGPSGWDWTTDYGVVNVSNFSSDRKTIIIQNNSEMAKCYVIAGVSNFGTISDITKPPPVYSFVLDPGASYFGDQATSALQHLIYVPSSSYFVDADAVTVTVTQAY